MTAVCPNCVPKVPIVIKQMQYQGETVVYVGPLRSEDRPANIIPASSMAMADKIASQAGFAKPKKLNF